MNDRRVQSAVTPALATGVLVLFSLAGLIGGAVTHGLVNRAGSVRTVVASPTVTRHATVSPRRSPTGAGVSPTEASPNAHFTLALTFSPAQVSSGVSLTITVKATQVGTSAPVGNLLCSLTGPSGGGGLLSTWPAPVATDQQGIATWKITVPQMAPGQYAVKVSASSADSYSAFWIAWIRVTD